MAKARAKPWSRQKASRRSASAGPPDEWAEKIVARIVADSHPKQRAAVTDQGRRIIELVGRGGGKTTAKRARLVITMLRIHKARCIFVAPTRAMAEELVWGPLKDMCERLGIEADFAEVKLKLTFKRTGSTLRLVSAEDKKEIDKLRGQPFDRVEVDEVAMMPTHIVDALVQRVIGPRLGERNGAICLSSTPGQVPVALKKRTGTELTNLFYEASRPGSKISKRFDELTPAERKEEGFRGWRLHTWTLQDGAATVEALARLWTAALEEKAINGWGDDNPIWMREYLGLWAADDTENIYKYRAHLPSGEPWNEWDPPKVGPMKVAQLPLGPDGCERDWSFGFGHDLGVKDPFALQVFAWAPIDPKRTLYHVFEFEKPEMYAQPIAQLWLGMDEKSPLGVRKHEDPGGLVGALGWPAGAVSDLAGNGDSVLLELKRVYGIPIAAAEKKGKFAAFELFNGHLVDGRIKILKGSKLAEQLTQLQWVENEVGEIRENKAQANHSADAALYCIRLIGHLFSTGDAAGPPPKSPSSQRAAERDPDVDPAPEDETERLLASATYDDPDDWGNL